MATLLGAVELTARALLPADSAAAPRRWLERRGEGDAAELVASARPPRAGAKFRRDAWPIAKAPGTTRIVCLGDSTVHGHPFDPPAPFSDWLAARLPELLPGRAFEVWNLGVNGMDSEEVAEVATAIAPLKPDLAFLYVGHNEFLDQHLGKSLRPLDHAIAQALAGSWAWGWLTARGSAGPAPVDPLLAALRRSGEIDDAPLLPPEAIARGLDRYEATLRTIVATLREAGATPLLVLPICDLRDTAPQRSTLPAGATPEARAALLLALGHLVERSADDRARLREQWPTVARLRYELGRLALAKGDVATARADLLAARDHDGHPIRATSELLARIARVASDQGVALVDPWPALDAAAPAIAGQDGWFVDYVHPDLRGHELLADALLHALAARSLLAPAAEWRFDREPDAATYRQRMDLTSAAQATSLARRGLFALGQGYLDPASALMKGAGDSFERALLLDPDCTLAFAGRGALALVRGDGDAALAAFDQALRRDPDVLAFLLDQHAASATVRDLFARARLTVRDGRIVRNDGG